MAQRSINTAAYDYFFKIILKGNSRVGKSNLLTRFVRDEFSYDVCTIGYEFVTQTISIDSKSFKAQLWEAGGHEWYRPHSKVYYRGVVGAMLIYDISKRDTYENINRWLSDLRENSDADLSIMLVGNKSDLSHLRAVSQEEAAAYATQNSLLFYETSALSSDNVEQAFVNLIAYIYHKLS